MKMALLMDYSLTMVGFSSWEYSKAFLLYKLREITPSSFVYSSIKSCQPALLFELLDFQAYTKSKFY